MISSLIFSFFIFSFVLAVVCVGSDVVFKQRLLQVQMEYELDHCPTPWKCPEKCYLNCKGCLLKNTGNN